MQCMTSVYHCCLPSKHHQIRSSSGCLQKTSYPNKAISYLRGCIKSKFCHNVTIIAKMKLFWWNASKKQSTIVNNEKLGHTFSISKLLLTKMREDLPVCTGRYRSSKITSTRNSRSLTRAISQCRLPPPWSTHLTIPTTCHSLIDSITVAVIGSKKATPGFRNMCSDELIFEQR